MPHAVIFLLCVSLLGCSRRQLKPVYAVTGVLRYNQQPLAQARVVLHPMDRAMLPTELPSSMTDNEGRFSLSTYRDADGAPTGSYRVAILPAGLKLEGPVPVTYADPHRSGLTARISAAATELPTMELTGPTNQP
jgi:hypothetical protein